MSIYVDDSLPNILLDSVRSGVGEITLSIGNCHPLASFDRCDCLPLSLGGPVFELGVVRFDLFLLDEALVGHSKALLGSVA